MAWFKKRSATNLPVSVIAGAPAIDMQEIVCKREDRVVFDRLTLQLDERRIGVVGDNGSGKSTFARLLNGLLVPDAGQLKIYGVDAVEHAASLPALVGFLFQNPDHQILFPTVLEELSFGLMQLGQKQADAESRARKFLRLQNRIEWADRPTQSLSEGEKQRLCLWAVLMMQPKLLVLDESFSSLDLRSRLLMMSELAEQQQQLLMITHELDLLADFDRVIWLHQGAVEADGPPDSVIASYREYALS